VQIDVSEKWLPVYEALASNVRIQIIQLLAKQPMNIKELAQSLSLSSAIMTMHVKKLEKSGIIQTSMVPSKGGVQKICELAVDGIEIDFPNNRQSKRESHQTVVSVGHYTDFQIQPTCGLATTRKIIGQFDDPRHFLDPERVDAKILWFTQGYIEYKVPNYLLKSQTPKELEISMEISSEAPLANDHWPSDITFFLNGINLGMWTSPGDYGGKRGKYTPEWWSLEINQFGLLKVLKINSNGTFMDGKLISNVTIDQIDILQKLWSFRIAVLDNAEHVGGLTLFGSGFGNYNQDIVFKLYYDKAENPTGQ
jgi:predicted transcriptional regulator